MSGAASAAWPWAALALLGAVHGLNPGMGWLFAVALGMQRGEARAVWHALLPLGLGHALAIAAALAVATAAGLVVPPHVLRWVVAAALLALGVRQLRRHAHPRGGGMRVGARDLVAWSFLVATAHGAGLMALPFAAGARAHAHGVHAHGVHAHVADPTWSAAAATLVHAASFLLVTGALAVLVYRHSALGLLRRAWVNLDVLWAAALVVTAAATLAL
ncbi:hypothetical protein J421_0621 [Gemmatirosa kalamazoonensis]|uniref:Uncharacterized protein n=1 Tax=Gemmatirosa kalamazoonensis TaxID=861299 RepID=W0RFJ1_9BACT|nr:hypothetical protein [Gemmatirosa kalamazoonensis]AHG88158.1 hypothetical protein J421_0621 [Gemmatirosa kalamazoonensis]